MDTLDRVVILTMFIAFFALSCLYTKKTENEIYGKMITSLEATLDLQKRVKTLELQIRVDETVKEIMGD